MIKDYSEGIDPVLGRYDALYRQWIFNVGGEDYVFDSVRMPFSVIDGPGGLCADRDLIVKYSDKQGKNYA